MIDDALLAATTMGLVAVIRRTVPVIDGAWVLLVAAMAALAVCAIYATPGIGTVAYFQTAGRVALIAVGAATSASKANVMRLLGKKKGSGAGASEGGVS